MGFKRLSGNFINPVMLCIKCILSNSSTTKNRGILEIPADLDLHWVQKAILYKNSFIGLKELNSSFIISVILSEKCVKTKNQRAPRCILWSGSNCTQMSKVYYKQVYHITYGPGVQ